MKTVPRYLQPREVRAVRGEELFLPPSSPAGVVVTPRVAMTVAAVFAAINVIATDVACLSLGVYRRLDGGGKEADRSHPVDDLVRHAPNDESTSFRFRQTMFAHALGYGGGYAEIQVRGDGRPYALHLLDPERTRPKRTPEGTLYYDLGDGRTLPPSRILHFAGLGHDAVEGYRLFDLARDAIGLGKAAELFGMTFFGNGSSAGGFLETPHKLNPEARKNLRESWEHLHRGPSNAHRTAVLEGGTKFTKSSVDPEQAQFLETRKFQVIEIARVYRLPPHKLGDYSESHLANLEEANQDYLQTTLMPWLEMSEQEMNKKLLTLADRRVHFIEHNMESLLRGNSQARATFYKQLFDVGVMSPNDIAARENLNPIPGGDKRFVPLNLTTLEAAGQAPAAAPAVEPAKTEANDAATAP